MALAALGWYHYDVALMRALMGLIRDRHGTYYAQRKVPERLQEAVARVVNADDASFSRSHSARRASRLPT